MKMKGMVVAILTVLILAFVFSHADAQLLKKIVKSKGGGGSDIVELMSNIPDDAQLVLSVNWENLVKTCILYRILNSLTFKDLYCKLFIDGELGIYA